MGAPPRRLDEDRTRRDDMTWELKNRYGLGCQFACKLPIRRGHTKVFFGNTRIGWPNFGKERSSVGCIYAPFLGTIEI